MRSSAEPRANATLAIALAEGDSTVQDIPRVRAAGRGGGPVALDIDGPLPPGGLGAVPGIPASVHRANGAPGRIANSISEDSR